MNNLSCNQLYIKYQEAQIDDYCQALDELTDVVGAM